MANVRHIDEEWYLQKKPFDDFSLHDKYYFDLTNELAAYWQKLQDSFLYQTLKLEPKSIGEASWILVSYFEDILNNIGIWVALSTKHLELYQSTVPLLDCPNDLFSGKQIREPEIKYLIWNYYLEEIPELIMNICSHKDLSLLARAIYEFLDAKKKEAPREDRIHQFLNQSNKECFIVKRKLIWFGTASYLFLKPYQSYMAKQDKNADMIDMTDEFILRECTKLSGFSPLDVLAEVIGLKAKEKKELLFWRDKHLSIYKLKDKTKQLFIFTNLLNNQDYQVPKNENVSNEPFQIGVVFHGSFVYWHNFWHWSANAKVLGKIPQQEIDSLKQKIMTKTPRIIYRFDKKLLKQAQISLQRQYKEFVDYFGDTLVHYDDGYKMAEEFQNYLVQHSANRAKEIAKEEFEMFKKKYNWTKNRPKITLPNDLLESKDVSLFMSRADGTNFFQGLTAFVKSIRKKGKSLTEDDHTIIFNCITSSSIGPEVFYKIRETCPLDSIADTFKLGKLENRKLEFLLRCYKGKYYKEIYPNVSLL